MSKPESNVVRPVSREDYTPEHNRGVEKASKNLQSAEPKKHAPKYVNEDEAARGDASERTDTNRHGHNFMGEDIPLQQNGAEVGYFSHASGHQHSFSRGKRAGLATDNVADYHPIKGDAD